MNKTVTFHDLMGASVFITGGGAGIGAALSEGFLAQGAKVAFVQRSDASGFVANMAKKYDNEPLFIPCDITDVDALKAAVLQAALAHGPVSVLINNAANDTRHTLGDYSIADFDQNIAVNLRPHFFTAQAVAEGMRNMGGGAIINFSSVSYMMGNSGYPVYATTKAAITGLTRSLARELGNDNIRVNALVPGWVMTDRQKELWVTPEAVKEHIARQCLKEELVPSDIADATLFLASNASRMITGQAMVVDGGVVVTG